MRRDQASESIINFISGTEDPNSPKTVSEITNAVEETAFGIGLRDTDTVAKTARTIKQLIDSKASSEDTFMRYGNTWDVTHKDYEAPNDGATDARSAIAAAAADAGGGTLFFPPGTYKISSNITLDEHLVFAQGAMLSIDNGITVTITGTIKAGLWQIATGSGTLALSAGSCPHVVPEWWGAVGDGSTDCTAAFNLAMTATQAVGKMILTAGTYKITSSLQNFPTGNFASAQDGISVEGVGTETIINFTDSSGYAFEVDSNDLTDANVPIGVTIKDLHIQAGSITDPDDGGCILTVGAFINIERVTTDDASQATIIHARARQTVAEEDTMTTDTNNDFTTTGAGATEKYAIKITTPARAATLKSITLRLGITGTPAGTIRARLYTNSAGLPNAQTGSASPTITISTISSGADGEDITFDWGESISRPAVSNNTVYWLVLTTSGYTYTDGVTELRIRVDAGDGETDGFATYDFGGTSWSSSNDGTNFSIICRYGQPLQTNVLGCGFQSSGAVGRGFWLEDNAFMNITNTYCYAKEGILSQFSYLETHNLYLITTGLPIYATGWSKIFGGTIEGPASPPSYFGYIGGTHRLIGVSNSAMPITWETSTTIQQIGCDKDFFWDTKADQVPDVYRYKIIPAIADNKRWDTYAATHASDADALNGYATQLNAANEYIQYVLGTTKNYHFLPRGTYRVTMYAKDTNQVANDFIVRNDFYDSGWSTDTENTYTLTADYQPYYLHMRVDANQVGSISYQQRIWMRKATGTANTISVSHIIIEYIGPDIVGTHNLVAIATDHSNADEARKNKVEFWGVKANDYEGALAQIQAQHMGSGNDYNGELDLKINTGGETYDTLYSILKLTNEIQAFPDGDAHPDIGGGNVFITNNSNPTTITDFHGAWVTSKQIVVIIGDSNTTIDFTGSDLKGNSGVDWKPNADDYMICTYESTDWHCAVSPGQAFGDGTNYTHIAADGFATWNGTARATEDMHFDPSNLKIPAANAPQAAEIGLTPVFLFDKTADEELRGAVEIPHNYDSGTDLQAHFHWAPVDADAGDVTWGIEWHTTTADNDEILTEATTTQIVVDATGSRQDEHLLSGNITLDGTGLIGEMYLHFRIFRDANASEGGASDTYDDDAALISFDIEYMKGSLGVDRQW